MATILRRGSRGPEVQHLQELLNKRLQPSPNLRKDGHFGPRTEAAVRMYQASVGLSIDGVAGPLTWEVLERPVLRKAKDRKESIINNTPAIFPIEPNPKAVDIKPIYEIESQSDVGKWCGLIIQISREYKIDSELVKAIMYMETTHGWYDAVNPFRRTILPMNIHYEYWRELGVTPGKLNVPHYNIEFGVILLSRIRDRIEDPTIAKIATLYNSLAAEKVSDYGARVASLYWEKPWTNEDCKK